ncbi:expansin EXLX1 family cellulose-binding protein [Ruminococcus sp.]|uniref:expansin EXLX1 family cellulose-binding protein n=1 Tax=Ruminococcus sp. TaxID=41978 RepID=UPI002BE1BFF4|nr:expansin EXLX1 family cellulose-binding protein [Ruminococcus sp.]HNZ98963.1 expansin EXLX1 family cellulose-binding protein [Ruminococcus sp.]HOH87725.1 expansin EXLX1 family cellulose-binding protein [Ruminococcus sp.]
MQKNKVITGRLTAAAVSAVLAAVSAGGYLISAVQTFPAAAAGASESESSDVTLSMGLSAGGSKIGISFYLSADGEPSDYDITLDGAAATPQVTDKGWLITADEFAMNMNKTHTVKVSKDGDELLSKEVSVSDYLHSILDDSTYASYHDLAKAMLRYGGAAQAYFGVDTNNLADKDIEGADYSGVTIDSERHDNLAFNDKFSGTGLYYYGMNLSLRSELRFTLYFRVADGADIAEAKAFLEGFTFAGNRVKEVPGANNYLTFSVDVPATALNKAYTFTNGTISEDFKPVYYLKSAVYNNPKYTKLVNVCNALYAYGKAAEAQKDKPVTPDEPQWILEEKGKVHSGEATYYDLADDNLGNASLNDVRGDYYYAAMNTADYNTAMLAGAYVEVTGPKGSVDVYIVDRLPEGAKGDIDLDPAAFEKIADKVDGRVPITWKIIPFDKAETEPMSYRYKTGATKYWFEMQVFNQKYPIYSLELLQNGKYIEVPREEYNYFNLKGAVEPGPFTFRITDIYGHVVIEEGVDLKDNDVTPVKGTKQFPD